jgi:putative toxin-antitoxin system antitoxin component (TIGR02293 family)
MFPEALRGEALAVYRRRLRALLEIPEDANEMQIHTRIVARFPAQRLAELCEQGDVPAIVRDWTIPPRTLKTRLNRGERLTVDESDRLFRTAHIIALAQALFGESEKAKCWLSQPMSAFDGQVPFEMIRTTQGMQLVEERIIQGIEGLVF